MSIDPAGDLGRAIAADEIVPFFQPVVALRTGRLAGFEVLARWRHKIRGIVHPNVFIPLAEATGLIGPLTDRLLAQACHAAAAWPEPVMLSVNLSPVDLADRAVAERLSAAVEATGFPFRRLIFEITEAVLIGDLAQAREVTAELKALGASLALDDFGTGYANLSPLRALPFDRLKIDASFVRTMGLQRADRHIVAAMVGLGHSLGLDVVAEGVETQAHADMLASLGCDFGQGWLFGRPLPVEQVPALLAARPSHDITGRSLARIAQDVAHRLEALPAQCISQLRALYDDAPVGLGLLDRSLRYLSLNRRLADMHNATVAAHLGRPAVELLPGDLYAKVEPHLRRALAGEAVTDFASCWRGPDGEHVLLASYQPVRDVADEVIGVSVAVVDHTERSRACRPVAPGASPWSKDLSGLTARQNDVLRLLAAGRTVKEIARDLGLSIGTVKVHLAAVYRLLGVRNRLEAVRVAASAADGKPLG